MGETAAKLSHLGVNFFSNSHTEPSYLYNCLFMPASAQVLVVVITCKGDLFKGDFPESSGLQVWGTHDSDSVSFNPQGEEGS